MKTMTALTVATALAFATLASARPLVIQENARIANPDPANYTDFPIAIGVDGDDAMIELRTYHSNYPEYEDEADSAVWLFRRVNGTWTPIRQILTDHDGPYAIHGNGISMQNGIAALAMNPLYIFERRNGDWVQAPLGTGTGGGTGGPGHDIEVDAGRIFYGASDGIWSGTLLQRDAATGEWRATQGMFGDYRGGDIDYSGGPVDISGPRALVLSPYAEEPPYDQPSVTLFRQFPDGTYYTQSRIANTPSVPLGYEAAVRGDEVFIAGTNRTGTHVFRPGQSDSWVKADTQLRSLDSHMGAGETGLIRKNEQFIFQSSYSVDRGGSVINVFSRDAAGIYSHVATLAASGNDPVRRFAVSGRRVIAACGEVEACVFDIPTSLTQPAVIQDTFAGTTPTGWTPSAGSAFSIAQSGTSRVLRQTETASTATHTALLAASNWTNQAVEADVRATAFNGADRWLGLATRYASASNYYYVTLRSSGNVALKRMRNGAFVTLASAPVAVTTNRTYRLRLESIGSRHRVFVDGTPFLDVDDTTLASGRAALLTYRTAAEFDNVIASPTPATTLYARTFESQGGPTDTWTYTGPGLWSYSGSGSNGWLMQSSVAGDARAIAGVPTGDQSIDVRVRPTTFAGTGSGDRWFGAMARYVDDSNYYYLSVRSSNTVSIRKLVNGSITVLASTALPVQIGTWYSLRIEAIGTKLRGYVNGVLVLEVDDSSHARGATGLLTYRAAADFDDYRAVQP
jgi:hypothetical protein